MWAFVLDPIRDKRAIPNSGFVEFVDVGDDDSGMFACRTWDGKWVSQIPNRHAMFENVERDAPGPHETFAGGKGTPGVKTTWTNPHVDPQDEILSYFLIQLPNS